MRNRGLVIALLLSALAGVNARAAGKIETCSPDQTLVFSNGVWNTELDWQAALRQTVKFYKKQRLTFKQGVNFSHPSESVGQDMLEVFLLKSREPSYNKLTVAQKMAVYVGLTTKELNEFSLDSIAAEQAKGLKTDWNKLVKEHSAESLLRLANRNIESAVAGDIAKAKSSLLAGQRLLIVAHSQGNLYANVVLRELFKEQKLASLANNVKMVGVAVPSSFITAPNGKPSVSASDYITRDDDGVINRLREKTQAVGAAAPLPFNVRGDAFSDIAGLGHRYVEGYLEDGGEAGRMVREKLVNAYNFFATQDPTWRVGFDLKLNLEFPTTAATKIGLDNYLIVGNDSLQGENGIYATSTVHRTSDYSVAVTAQYFCRTLDSLPVGYVKTLPVGMEFPGSVPAPLKVTAVVEAMGASAVLKEGTPFRMPADTTGSTHYYQSTLEWRKQHKGATLSSY